jgi:uncharacterized membrane protein
MSYQEKRIITTIITGVLILAAYGIYVFQQYQAGVIDMEKDLRFWAAAMLIFIGVGIVLMIVILIVFHIINAIVNEAKKREQEDPSIEDEMDKLIALKATRNSYAVVGVGFVLSMASLVMQMPPAVMLNILFLSFNLGSIFEGFSQLYYYRRGIQNG